MPRHDDRANDQLRPITIQPNFLRNAAGSVLISCGNTRVICAVSVEDSVPSWMKAEGKPGGWVTGEYDMLPASTNTRKRRAASTGKVDGRSTEIQRLIGRALRAMLDLQKLPACTYAIDCDVIDADGGTRCASITGAAVALQLAFRRQFIDGRISKLPDMTMLSAVSVGIVDGVPVLDLDYVEDKAATVDMNVVMTAAGRFVEIQGTGEEATFTRAESDALLDLAAKGCRDLAAIQQQALGR